VIGSVILSQLLYYLSTLIFNIDYWLEGVFLCFIIPALVSYPMSLIMYNYQLKIKKQRDELQKLDRLNKQIFTLISHDIRTPITNASQLIGLIESGTISSEDGNELLREVNRSYTEVMVFFDDLLYWSKQQLENKPFIPVSFDGSEVIQRYLRLFGPQINEKELEIRFKDVPFTLYADRGSFEFVIRNVLQNAIKYNVQHGEIQIEFNKLNGNSEIVISDRGLGITEDRLKEIRNNSEFVTSTDQEGIISTGFGLKTCIQYIESQKGSLTINSSKQSGSKVRITLPNSQ